MKNKAWGARCSNQLCFDLVGPDWVCVDGRCRTVKCDQGLDTYVCEKIGLKYIITVSLFVWEPSCFLKGTNARETAAPWLAVRTETAGGDSSAQRGETARK